MNLLFIGKYPPLEGGTSTAAYWRINALKKHGINFHVITACPYNCEYVLPVVTQENVTIISNKIPWHIPYSQLLSERLISSALEQMNNNHYDAIEGCYLYPYSYAAYIISLLTGKPLLIRHAGSDLKRLSHYNELSFLTQKIFSHATAIVSYTDLKKYWKEAGLSNKIIYSPRYVPNPDFFYCSQKNNNAAFFGKITPKWNNSQLDFYYDSLNQINFNGKICIYSIGIGANQMKEFFIHKGYEVEIFGYVSPIEASKIMSTTKIVLVASQPEDICERSNTFLEAIKCGCTVLAKDSDIYSIEEYNYEKYLEEQIQIYREICNE